MTKSRFAFLLASGLVVVPLILSGLGRAWASAEGSGEDSRFRYLSVFTEVLSAVRQAYVEEPDLRVLMGGALDGATDALDPFSTYVPADQVKSYDVNRAASRELSGMVVLKDRGVAWVVALDEGGPADVAGLRRGDIISELAGVSTRSMPMWRIHQMLGQKEGTRLTVSAVRSSDDRDFELLLGRERPELVLELAEAGGMAHLRLPRITPETVAAVRDLLPEVGDRRLLLDIRGAVGGDPEAAYDLAALFTTGALGELRARSEVLETFANDVAASYSGSVVLLQDRSTQGAGEILASVLGGLDNVTMLGEPTFGHAGRLGRERLSSGGILEFTVAFYTGPDGEPINDGIEPDLQVRRRFTGEEENPDRRFLEQALEVLREAEADEEDEAVA